MRITLEIDALSAAFQEGLTFSLTPHKRIRTNLPRYGSDRNQSESRGEEEESGESWREHVDDDDEYDLDRPESHDWVGHWVLFDGDTPGYYNDFREVQRVTAAMPNANVIEYGDEPSAQRAYESAVRKARILAAASASDIDRRDRVSPTPTLSCRPHPTTPTPTLSHQPYPTTPTPTSSRRLPSPARSIAPMPSLSHQSPSNLLRSRAAPAPPPPTSLRSPHPPINADLPRPPTSVTSHTPHPRRHYPEPYIGPPSDDNNRDEDRSTKNKHKCWAVFIGRRPGIYFTWRETFAQINGVSKCSQTGYESFLVALAAYRAKGMKGEVRVSNARRN